MTKLGKTQLGVLRALSGGYGNGQGDRPWPGRGWTWSTSSETRRILESLERRGLVTVTGENRGLMGDFRQWHINDAGRSCLTDTTTKGTSR